MFGDQVASELARFKAYGSINAYQEQLITSVINVYGSISACQERPIKRAINACQDISVNMNMAEGVTSSL